MKMKDKRAKGCPTENCVMHTEKVKQSTDNVFCPKCGAKLVYVCKKCFRQIEDIDPKHQICKLCEAKAEEKHRERKEKAKAVGARAAVIGAGIGAGIVNKVGKDFEKEVINKGAKVVDKVVKAMLKK